MSDDKIVFKNGTLRIIIEILVLFVSALGGYFAMRTTVSGLKCDVATLKTESKLYGENIASINTGISGLVKSVDKLSDKIDRVIENRR